jgi:hypothetical protein
LSGVRVTEYFVISVVNCPPWTFRVENRWFKTLKYREFCITVRDCRCLKPISIISKTSFKGPPRADFATVLETLKNVEVPIASIDVPSGKDIYSYLCIYYHPSGGFFQINWGPSWS